MRVRNLRTYNLPDVGDHLIHFTGRNGLRINVDPAILRLSPGDRLLEIIMRGVIFGVAHIRRPRSCRLSDREHDGLCQAADWEARYEPCAIGFSKQLVFDQHGGPALYVRGDEWDAMRAAVRDEPLRSRMVRFWPGAEAEPGEDLHALEVGSQWLHEREWRVPSQLRFGWHDVKFLIVPGEGWHAEFTEMVRWQAGDVYAAYVDAIPVVVMDQAGNVVRDDVGIWMGNQQAA